MEHHDIRNGQGVPLEVCRPVDIEPCVDAFQIILLRQRCRVDQLIICRINRKAVAPDRVQRLKTVIQRFIPAFQLVDGKAVLPDRPRLLHDIRRCLHKCGSFGGILLFRLLRKREHFIHTGPVRV